VQQTDSGNNNSNDRVARKRALPGHQNSATNYTDHRYQEALLATPLQKRLAKSQRLGDVAQWSKTFSCDGANGVNLYRANGLGFGAPTTEVPVQLIVPTKDSFLTPAVYADAKLFAPHLTRIDVVAGHWVIRTHAELIAERIATFVDEN